MKKCTKYKDDCNEKKDSCEGCYYYQESNKVISREYVEKQLKEKDRQIKIKDEYLSLITGIGFDYDGEDGSIDGLKGVIDQLVDYARKALDNDDKSIIYGIFDDDIKRNILLEPIEIPEPLEELEE